MSQGRLSERTQVAHIIVLAAEKIREQGPPAIRLTESNMPVKINIAVRNRDSHDSAITVKLSNRAL